MKLQCLVLLLCSFVAVQSASFRQREIPVHVIYAEEARSGGANPRQRLPQDELQAAEEMKLPEKCDPEIATEIISVPDGTTATSEAGDAKAEIVAEESQTIEEKQSADIHLNSIRNLDAKNQLSPEEEKEKIKHLPGVVSDLSLPAILSDEVKSDNIVRPEISESNDVKSSEILKPESIETSNDNKVEEPAGVQRPEYVDYIVDQAKDIACMGIRMLKEKYFQAKEFATQHQVTEEDWNRLQKNVEELFVVEKQRADLKQDSSNQNQNQNQNPTNIIQNIVNGFQNITNTFMQNLQQGSSGGGNGTQQEGEQPGFGQGFFNFWSTGIQQVINNINSLNNPNGGGAAGNGTAQADTGTGTTQRPNIISNIVNSVQQFFGNQGNQQQNINNQSDTGAASGGNNQGPGGFFQGAVNQFSQAINNFIPGNQPTPAPGSQGDTGTGNPSNQNPIQAIQQVFNQFNPFANNSAPSGSSGDDSSTQAPSFGQNIGQVIQNFNPFRPQQSGSGGDQSSTANPVVAGIQNAGNQIQQAIGNQSFGNPVEQFQNAVSGVQNGSNPINQIQNAIQGGQNGGNPISSIQNAITGGQTSADTPIQTAANLVQAASTIQSIQTAMNGGKSESEKSAGIAENDSKKIESITPELNKLESAPSKTEIKEEEKRPETSEEPKLEIMQTVE